MLRVIGIGGYPATGKSTLMKAFMERLDMWWSQSKFYSMKFHICESKRTIVLGYYEPCSKFGGTDRLSMSVQPEAVKFIEKMVKKAAKKDWVILFEGDRLFNSSFIGELWKLYEFNDIEMPDLVVLKASDDILENRHKERKDTQTEIWLKGRITKINNIASHYWINDWYHETKKDTDKCVTKLMRLAYPEEE